MSPQCLQSSFGFIRPTVREHMSFEDFQDGRHGGHLGYRNGTTLRSNSESLCRSGTYHEVSAQYNLLFGKCRMKNFKMAAAISAIGIGTILAVLNLYVFQISLTKTRLYPTYRSGADIVWRVSRWHGGHLAYRNETILAILNLFVTLMPPIKFWLNLTYDLGRGRVWYVVWRISNSESDVVWRVSRWPPRRPSLISDRNDF